MRRRSKGRLVERFRSAEPAFAFWVRETLFAEPGTGTYGSAKRAPDADAANPAQAVLPTRQASLKEHFCLKDMTIELRARVSC